MLKYGLTNVNNVSQHHNSSKKEKLPPATAEQLAKQNSLQTIIPSTLDPANPLSLTTVAKIKKLPTQQRSSMGNKPPQQLPVSNFMAQSAVSQSHVVGVPSKLTKNASISSNKNFKMYGNSVSSSSQITPDHQAQHNHNSQNTLAIKYTSNALTKSQQSQSHVLSARAYQASPKPNRSSLNQRSLRCGGSSPSTTGKKMGARSSIGYHQNRSSVGAAAVAAGEKEQASISHSQATIEKSRHQRMNSGGRVIQGQQSITSNTNDIIVVQTDSLISVEQNPHVQTGLDVPFEETMRDEVVNHLRQSLENERKKHREIKQIFDETMQNIEAQNRHVPTKAIEMQASKAVDEILTHGAVCKSALEEELEKQRQLIEEMKQRETDKLNQVQLLEKKLMHSQMREKESQAQEQIRLLQQETSERKLKMEVEKYKEQVKDLRNNEEQIKSDHVQKVLELTDQTEEVRARQAAEDEERYMKQINEIKQTHARERDSLVQQKFVATQELQMIKMDHSELIRNTNFEEQRELIETITAQQAQIQHLSILLSEQKSNFELQKSQLEREKKQFESKVEQLESCLETTKHEKATISTELNSKCKDLEDKLQKATKEKEKTYKNQMEKIQENLESLKEQIQSTNQSLMDQTMAIPLAESSSLALGPVGRLQSPDFYGQRHQRGEPISISSPRVPRIHARLQQDSHQRMQSPLAAVATRHQQREKSGDQRGFMTGSEMQELTQMMSNGTAEQTMNLGVPTAGQALFNQTSAHVGGGAQNNTNSFLLDPIFNDYYVEYVMLHKLQALTNNFTCQNCWQVLNFSRFFDEDHLCLNKIGVPGSNGMVPNGHQGSQQHYQVKHSQIGSAVENEEFKDSRGISNMNNGQQSQPLAENSLPRLRNLAAGQDRDSHEVVANDGQKIQRQHSTNSARHQRSSSAYYKRVSSHSNMANLMKATAQAATGGVMVTEIHLSATNESKRTGRGSSQDPESRQIATGSFQQSSTARENNHHLETSIDSQLENSIQKIVVQQAPIINSRQQVNSMQLHAYVQKIKEYRVQIVNLEEELRRCKQENESLIFDLRDSKTKVAVLEENKAQLQMELARERKRQVKQTIGQAKMNAETKIADQRSPVSPPALNVTVNTQSYGVFGLGGKSNYSVKVLPALNSQQKQNAVVSTGKAGAVSSAQLATDSDQKQLDLSPSKSRFNQSEEKLRDRDRNQNKTMNKALLRSPQSRMVPLSQKFSALPTSEYKTRGQGGYGPGGIAGSNTTYGYTRNMDISLQTASQAGLASHRSLNNLTQQLNSSVNNLRGGRTTRQTNDEVDAMYHMKNNNMMAKCPQQPTLQPQRSMKEDMRLIAGHRSSGNLLAPHCSAQHRRESENNQQCEPNNDLSQDDNESCDISPEHDGSGRRHIGQDARHNSNYKVNMKTDNNLAVEETEELSQINPLQTDRGATTNRCSIFDEQQQQVTNRKNTRRREDERDNHDVNTPEDELARSQRMIKLNNPYDQVSITRLQKRMSKSPEQDGRFSPGGQRVNATRKTIFPGSTTGKLQQKKKTQQNIPLSVQQHQIATPPPVMIKNAVPLSSLSKINSMQVERDHHHHHSGITYAREPLSARVMLVDHKFIKESDGGPLAQTGNFSHAIAMQHQHHHYSASAKKPIERQSFPETHQDIEDGDDDGTYHGDQPMRLEQL